MENNGTTPMQLVETHGLSGLMALAAACLLTRNGTTIRTFTGWLQQNEGEILQALKLPPQ